MIIIVIGDTYRMDYVGLHQSPPISSFTFFPFPEVKLHGDFSIEFEKIS